MTVRSQMMDFSVEADDGEIVLTLPAECSDITLNWTKLFHLADAIGSLAFHMVPHVSDPGQDAAIADFVRLGRTGDRFVVIYFQKRTARLTWTKNQAMIVAEKMAMMAETIQGEIEKRK